MVVVGAGVSGLAAAHRLSELAPECQVRLIEAGPRAGGLIRSDSIHLDGVGDFLVEQGPDSIISDKPAAWQLAQRLGLESEIVSTNTKERGAFVVCRGSLERIPEGFSMMAPSQIMPIVRSPILSTRGKLRLFSEVFIPRSKSKSDESTASFVERRFGREVLSKLAEPLMGGIYGTRLDQLSLAATMPRFADLERTHRSVTLGLWAKRRAARKDQTATDRFQNEASASVRYGLFFSFRRGVQTLTDALVDRAKEQLMLNQRVTALRPVEQGFEVELDSGEVLQTHAVILAQAARPMAKLLKRISPELSTRLYEIPYGSTATIAFAWPREAIPHALNGFGFVVPPAEKRRIIASTWASRKFAGRAPEGFELIRVFFGGDAGAQLLQRTDEELALIGRQELKTLIGVTAPPLFTSVWRQEKAMPKYTLGHGSRAEAIRELAEQQPRVALAGNSLFGVGIPDAIRSGELAAEKIAGMP